jgi:predicted PurR-regulated permease PerM
MIDRAVRTEDERRVVAMLRWLLIVTFVVLGYITLKYVAAVMTPLIAAFAIAYLLQPVLDRLVARGISRPMGAAALLVGFLGAGVFAVAAAVPLLTAQVAHFVQNLPVFVDTLNTWAHAHLNVSLPADWASYLKGQEFRGMVGSAAGPLRYLATVALGSVVGFLSVLGEMLLIPVFAFYFLADWKGVVERIHAIVPPRRRSQVRELVDQIDGVVSGWVRGQAIVTVILAVLYSLAFSIIHMPLAVAIGLVVGALTVIPFVGTVVGAALALTIALAGAPDGEGVRLALQVAGIIGVLHLLEAVVLTPKIVGHRVGLSESSALFAVLAGGKLLGFVGVVLAVPLAATVGVLVRHGFKLYESSSFFGPETDDQVPVSPAMAAVLPAQRAAVPRTRPTVELEASEAAEAAARAKAEAEAAAAASPDRDSAVAPEGRKAD